MSHYLVLVVPGKETMPEKIKSRVETLLKPFDEQLEVKEHEVVCGCINMAASREGRTIADSKLGDLDSFRDRFKAKYPGPVMTKNWDQMNEKEQKAWAKVTDAHDAQWVKFIQPWKDCAEKAEKRHTMYQKPDPTCEDCHGAGKHMTTRNEQGRWDWYQIGGRWGGHMGFMVTGKEGHSDFVRITKANYKKISGYSVVTPDGKWHSKGQMGWFGLSKDMMDEKKWARHQRALFKKYIGWLVVGVDCHV